MPRAPKSSQLAPSPTFTPYRETAASKSRRGRNYPNDFKLDFDTQILALFWFEDGTAPGQVTVYPRDDLRVRLSDHKIALAEGGFEMSDREIMVYVRLIDGGCRECSGGWGWADCGWDTPLRVHSAGDAILLSYADVTDLKDFPLYERHVSGSTDFTMAPSRTVVTLPRIIPRITDPYSGDNGYAPILSVEAARVAHNQEVCRLREAYEKAKERNSSIVNERDRWEANRKFMKRYYTSESSYEDMFGKFVPDSENAAWFAKINPRIAELLIARESLANVDRHDHPDMVKYLAAAKAFEEDFGHAFTAHDAADGLDEHFNRMAFHAWVAQDLASKCAGDTDKLGQILSAPLNFVVYNPYRADEFCSEFNDKDFDMKLREIKRKLEGDAAVEKLPSTVLQNFPFSLSFTDLQGYYDARYTEEQLFEMSVHHAEELSGDVGGKRENRTSTPLPRRPPLWSDEMYENKGLERRRGWPYNGKRKLTSPPMLSSAATRARWGAVYGTYE
ncbi:hypothetical protein B0H12DRAFT_1075306 [Mycena haematopus]|nr:hypothetical protein B0H12DRAFT_1075306 [Mycena haematopus]